jgi:hypothetical protein
MLGRSVGMEGLAKKDLAGRETLISIGDSGGPLHVVQWAKSTRTSSRNILHARAPNLLDVYVS